MKVVAAAALLLQATVAQPESWLAGIAAQDILYSAGDQTVPLNAMPLIGNGFVATQLMSADLYVSLVYNGYLTTDPSHRARIPATNAIAAPGSVITDAALHLRNATYLRRSYIDPSTAGSCTLQSNVSCSNAGGRVYVEQRWYAHRVLPSVMVFEVEVLTEDAALADYPHTADAILSAPDDLEYAGAAAADAPFVVLRLSNADGGPSSDFDFSAVAVPAGSPFAIINGTTLVAETNSSGLQGAAVLTTNLQSAGALPGMVTVPAAGVTLAFLTVVRTTVETQPANLVAAVQADYAAAMALADNGTLYATHVQEWALTLWPSGYETDRRDVAAVANASLYALLSSVRTDRIGGICPSGLTDGYNDEWAVQADGREAGGAVGLRDMHEPSSMQGREPRVRHRLAAFPLPAWAKALATLQCTPLIQD